MFDLLLLFLSVVLGLVVLSQSINTLFVCRCLWTPFSLCRRHSRTHTLCCCRCRWSYEQMRQALDSKMLPLLWLRYLTLYVYTYAPAPCLWMCVCFWQGRRHTPLWYFTFSFFLYIFLVVARRCSIFYFTFQCFQLSCSYRSFSPVFFSILASISSHSFVYFEIVYYVLQNIKYHMYVGYEKYIYLFLFGLFTSSPRIFIIYCAAMDSMKARAPRLCVFV